MRDPICILRPGKNTAAAVCDLKELATSDILDLKVVVISIAGRRRQGKSFLMDLIIKYLRAQGTEGWMESDAGNKSLREFASKRATLGVLIWPEIFKLRNGAGEDLAVILMDTQGVFDTEAAVEDCASIISLSFLLSSIQILNVKQNIQSDDLGRLELLTELGRLIGSENSERDSKGNLRPFQDLILLVRDWAHPEKTACGWNGGQRILNEELERVKVEGESAKMRSGIKDSFESLKCFLMPHPGETVDTAPQSRWEISDIGPIMKSFIEDLLHPTNLKPKGVKGNELTVRDFLVFVELYVREMFSDKSPTPQNLYDATVEATNSTIVNSCFEMYQDRVTALSTRDPKLPASFEGLLDDIAVEVYVKFARSTTMGSTSAIETASKELCTRIADAKQLFMQANSAAYDRKHLEAEKKAQKREGGFCALS